MVHPDTHDVWAAVAMDSWSPNSCQLHWAIENPLALRHGFLQAVTDYAFDKRGVNLIIGLVPSNNEKALKLNTHLGMTESHRVRDAYAVGVDYVIMELRPADCKWREDK